MPPQKKTEPEEFHFVGEDDDETFHMQDEDTSGESFEFVDEKKPTKEPSWWDKLFTAPEFVTKPAHRFAEAITDPNLKKSISKYVPKGLGGVEDPEQLTAYGTGFLGGSVEGAAEQASPGNIALLAAGGGEAAAIKSGTKLAALGKMNEARRAFQAARALELPTRAAGAVTAYHGGTTLLNPEATLGQKLTAIPQIAGGILGMRSRAYGVAKGIEERPPQLKPEATDIPLTKQGDVFAREDVLGPEIIRRDVGEGPIDAVSEARQALQAKEFITPEGPTDPRITSVAPPSELEEIPGVGMAGPVVKGISTGKEEEPQVNVEEARAKIEAARASEKAKVDQELAGIPQTEAEEVNQTLQKKPAEISTSLPVKPSTIVVKQDIPNTVNKLLKQGYKFIARTPEGHIKMSLEGGEVSELPSEADRGPKTMREINLEHIDRLRSKGMEKEANELAEYLEKGTEAEPDEILKYIKEDFPELSEEAMMVHGEQNPETISKNFENYRQMMQDMAEHANDAMPPAAREAFDEEYQKIGQLLDLANAKYHRTSQRMLAGNPAFAMTKGKLDFNQKQDAIRDIIKTLHEEANAGNKESQQILEAEDNAESLNREIRRRLPFYEQEGFTSHARVGPEGSMKARMDIGDRAEMIKIFRNTYAGSVPQVAVKELLQNALDAVQIPTGVTPNIKVNVNQRDNTISVEDNGPGLNVDQLQTVYTNLSESGKRGVQKGSIGELGVGKTTYLVAGQHVLVQSVTREADGRLVLNTFAGSPETILEGFDIKQKVVPEDTPTGTKVTVTVKPKSNFYSAEEYLDRFETYSNNPAQIELTTQSQYGQPKTKVIPPRTVPLGAPLVEGREVKGTKYNLYIPEDASTKTGTNIPIVVNNRGMFQGVDTIYVQKGRLPTHFVIDLDPTVIGTDEDYPLTAPTRERLKDEVRNDVTNWINENIVKKAREEYKELMKRIYNEMQLGSPDPNVFVAYDFGGKFTASEMQRVLQSPIIRGVGKQLQQIVQELRALFPHELLGEIEHTGFIFDGERRGVNIQNPETGTYGENGFIPPKYSILVNPFSKLDKLTPKEAMNGLMHVILHEFTHAAVREEGSNFTAMLADVYEKFPLEAQIAARKRFENLFIARDGGYNPEVQRLLQLYTESRGRTATNEDFLIGERSLASSATTGSSAIPGSNSTAGGGATGALPARVVLKKDTKEIRKGWADLGYIPTGESDPQGRPIWSKPTKTASPLEEIWNLSRGLTSVDLPFLTSAALRQGVPVLLFKPAVWARAFWNSMRAYGAEHTYNSIMNEISRNPLFRRRDIGGGKTKDSIARELGLELTDVGHISNREEVIKSKWAEKLGPWGKHVAASNRAYSAFVNTARAGLFTRLYEQAKLDSRSLTGGNIPARDMETDVTFGKEVVEAINTLTGRGRMKIDLPFTSKKISFERAAGVLTNAFFSPRLQFSRLKMLNPATYINADPFVRKIWLKGLISAIGTWWAISSLAEIAGADVSKDPNNADYGKIKMGNTRFDPGSGFQQMMVLFSRLRPEWFKSPVDIPYPPYGELTEDPGGGRFTSSTSGGEYKLEGFGAGGRFEKFGEFLASKEHPSLKFILDLFRLNPNPQPFHVGDRAMQMAIPMMFSDLKETFDEDPTLIPFVIGAGSIGLGAQTYEGGKPEPSFLPEDYDVVLGDK